MSELLFQYWRAGTKMKDILENHKGWTAQLVSDNLKFVMENYFKIKEPSNE